jgi:hypothetical protein
MSKLIDVTGLSERNEPPDDPYAIIKETIGGLIDSGVSPNMLNVLQTASRLIYRRGRGYVSELDAWEQAKATAVAMEAAGQLYAPSRGPWRLIAAT